MSDGAGLPRTPGPIAAAITVAPALMIVVLALFHGGFYAVPVCVVASVAVAAYAARTLVCKANPAIIFPSVCLAVVALALLASALAHGATAAMLQEAAKWFALAGMSMWCLPSNRYGTLGGRGTLRTSDAIAIGGAAVSGIGILAYAGIIPIERAADAGRLAFPFEYANASGLFFAVSAMLCLGSTRRKLQIAALIPIAALLLTRSVGAIGVFALAAIALFVRWIIACRPALFNAVVQTALLAAACGLAVFALRDRLAQATQTAVERIVQMADGASLLSHNILLGIGPDQWQFAYPHVQTAQYQATVAHCSYLQIALDGGVLAAGALAALLVVGIFRSAKKRDSVCTICLIMVFLHACIDFDLRFAAISLLAAALAGTPCAVECGDSKNAPATATATGAAASAISTASTAFATAAWPSPRIRQILCWGLIACTIVSAGCALAIEMQETEVRGAASRSQTRHVVELIDAASWFDRDQEMQLTRMQALYGSGAYEAVLETPPIEPYEPDGMALYRALGYLAIGDRTSARTAFADVLHAHPYSIGLYSAVRGYIEAEDLGSDFRAAFSQEAIRANGLARTGHAAWLRNQETVEPFELAKASSEKLPAKD